MQVEKINSTEILNYIKENKLDIEESFDYINETIGINNLPTITKRSLANHFNILSKEFITLLTDYKNSLKEDNNEPKVKSKPKLDLSKDPKSEPNSTSKSTSKSESLQESVTMSEIKVKASPNTVYEKVSKNASGNRFKGKKSKLDLDDNLNDELDEETNVINTNKVLDNKDEGSIEEPVIEVTENNSENDPEKEFNDEVENILKTPAKKSLVTLKLTSSTKKGSSVRKINKSPTYNNRSQGYIINYTNHEELNYAALPSVGFDEEFKDPDKIVIEMSKMVEKVYNSDARILYDKYVDNLNAIINNHNLTEYINDKLLIKITKDKVSVFQGMIGKTKSDYKFIKDEEWEDIKEFNTKKPKLSKNMTYYDFFTSPLINSVHMFDQDLISKIYPRNPLLQFVLFNDKTLDDFVECKSTSNVFDYSNILATVKKNTLAKRAVIAKEIFKYRDGIIHHPKIEAIKEQCWLDALTKIDFVCKSINEEINETCKNILQCWRNILGSRACYMICMNGVKPNKFFAKYFDLLISDKYSLSLMLGPLYSISWLFTPFMLDGEKFNYGTKSYTSAASISKVFTECVVKVIENINNNLIQYDDLIWCAELFKEKEHENKIVNLIGIVYATYETSKDKLSNK